MSTSKVKSPILFLVINLVMLGSVRASAEISSRVLDFKLIRDFKEGRDNVEDLYVHIPNFIKSTNELAKTLTELSFCCRFYTATLKYQTVFTVGDSIVFGLHDLQRRRAYVGFDNINTVLLFDKTIQSYEWHHICVSVTNDLKLNAALDGIMIYQDFHMSKGINVTTVLLNDIGLSLGYMKSRHEIQGQLFESNLFHGSITELDIWSKVLSEKDMLKITGRECILAESLVLKPDLFSWSSLTDNQQDAKFYSWIGLTRSTFCKKDLVRSELRLYTVKTSQEIGELMCNSLGGHSVVPRDPLDIKEIAVVFKKDSAMEQAFRQECQGLAFTGVLQKQADNGSYLHMDKNGNSVENLAFEEGQPNGQDFQKCITLHYSPPITDIDDGSISFSDYECSTNLCTFCMVSRSSSTWFNLRGALPDTMKVDRKYIDRQKGTYSGIMYTRLQWQQPENWWQAHVLIDNKPIYLGHNVESNGKHVLGKRDWDLDNHTYPLLLSLCQNDSFTCHKYGNCIPIEFRCDGIYDCPEGDLSDEEDCGRVIMNQDTYRKDNQPLKRNGHKLKIHVFFDLYKILSVKELDQHYQALFKLDMHWYDERLSYKNLRQEDVNNAFSKDDIAKIWYPVLIFANTDFAATTKSDDAQITVRREGLPTEDSVESLYQNMIYKGDENHLIHQEIYSLELQCEFFLRMFPFDMQKCPLEIGIPIFFTQNIELQLVNATKSGRIRMIQYDFAGFEVGDNDEWGSIVIKLKLRRIFKYHLATTYLPTFCLIVICELTLFIDESHFEATIMVALTTMLVMYTLYQSVSTTLPPTSYMKMIDIWLLMGLIVPFLVILVLMGIDAKANSNTLRKFGNDKKRKIETCLTISKFAVPILTGLFMAIYWIVALGHYFQH